MTTYNYDKVYLHCLTMQQNGLIHLTDFNRDQDFPNALDWFLLKLFDCDDNEDVFNERIEKHQLDIGWLFGPHAVALLKAKMIQRGMINV